jgi:hypothetical protein
VPTRKQRRRRAKERRHEYEYVYVDEEGHEVEVEPEETRAPERKDRRPGRAGGAGRVIDPPSWRRVGRRALIFGPLMFITIRLLESGEPIVASLLRTIFLLLIFLPFSYVMDAVMYRTWQRRMSRDSKR